VEKIAYLLLNVKSGDYAKKKISQKNVLHAVKLTAVLFAITTIIARVKSFHRQRMYAISARREGDAVLTVHIIWQIKQMLPLREGVRSQEAKFRQEANNLKSLIVL